MRTRCSPLLLLALALSVSTAGVASAQALSPVPSPPSNPVPNGPAVPLGLTEAVAIGLRDNRSLKSAYLERVVQKFDLAVAERRFVPVARITARVTEARSDAPNRDSTEAAGGVEGSWLLPTGGTIGFSWGRLERLDARSTDRRDTSSLSLTQPLLRGGGWDVAMAPLRSARIRERINKLSLESTVSNTVSTIIFSYRTLLQSQEQVRLAELSLERTKVLLETNKALIEAGRMAAADLVQTESGLANQEVSVLSAYRQRESAQLALLRLLALDPRTNVVAVDDVKVERVDIDLDRVLALGFDSRLDILSQRLTLDEARQGLMLAKNNRLWDVSLTASTGRSEVIDPILGPRTPLDDTTVGVRVGIPLGDYGPKAAELRAETAVRTAELRYEELSQAIEAQIRDAVQTVDMNWRQLEAARRARDLAARALDLQQEKLKVGRASNFEVLSFQDSLRNADAQELNARISYLNALTALDQQIGSTLETWRINLND
ncbi:TolC family protein [Caulobacter mirabilis]|uniref:Transporter n=1 Tax=Caulobacter mirabilis TaxID=69666 RepID=A0A2D2AW79_9CAUL|nr:TolC family protein [Caulobacter mirabilis]ATQ42260.1 transporter [Caulobacter mirabilis]